MKRIILVLLLLCVVVLPAIAVDKDTCPICAQRDAQAQSAGNERAQGGKQQVPEVVTSDEAMEWQCIYWIECTRYVTEQCEPCYGACLTACTPICSGAGIVNFYLGVACSVGCPLICTACPDCQRCVKYKRRYSCGWVFTE